MYAHKHSSETCSLASPGETVGMFCTGRRATVIHGSVCKNNCAPFEAQRDFLLGLPARTLGYDNLQEHGSATFGLVGS